jgi:hypothetical protein
VASWGAVHVLSLSKSASLLSRNPSLPNGQRQFSMFQGSLLVPPMHFLGKVFPSVGKIHSPLGLGLHGCQRFIRNNPREKLSSSMKGVNEIANRSPLQIGEFILLQLVDDVFKGDCYAVCTHQIQLITNSDSLQAAFPHCEHTRVPGLMWVPHSTQGCPQITTTFRGPVCQRRSKAWIRPSRVRST